MLDVLEDLTPLDIGLPGRFKSWRNIQKEFVELAIDSNRRFLAAAMPTGSGKTLAVMTLSRIWSDKRFCILTSTKGLQDQYATGFNPDPLLASALIKLGQPVDNLVQDIRGRNNYKCTGVGVPDKYTCDDGPKLGCIHHNSPSCEYSSRVNTCQKSKTVVTNYKWWMYANAATRGRALTHQLTQEPIDVLVLDEAHLAPGELSDSLSTRIGQIEVKDILGVLPPQTEDVAQWVVFANHWKKDLQDESKYLNDYINRNLIVGGRPIPNQVLRKLKATDGLLNKFESISRVRDNWICDQREGGRAGRVWHFDPIWPGAYAESYLFYNIPKIILISATVRPKTLSLLSVKGHEVDFREWPRIFPPARCPIYHIPTVRLNRSTSESDYAKWIDRIDRIIETRLDRKGIIHTGSYDRQKRIIEHSAYAHLFFANRDDANSPDAAAVYEKFLLAPAPAILVSPSFGTGWDFPGEAAEWQIITKIPFVNHTSKINVARRKRDPQYLGYLAMQELVQACGRPMRSDIDRGETFIIDDAINYFMALNGSLAPLWFRKRGTIHVSARIPAPPIALCEDPAYIKVV